MEKYSQMEFWIRNSEKLLNWSITEMPVIIVTIILFLVALKLSKKVLTKLKIFMHNRKYLEKSPNKGEAEKRLNTLIELLQGAVRITLWLVFIIIILSKIGIEVAPLLAGAGIVGLAVGFGAQELVRDVISGFFILLENQVRVGDVAIINGQAGTVEKIELRTMTLRDVSGIVHIFQNGKVNTLSNMTKDWSATVLEIGVAYKENIAQVIKIMQDVGANLKSDNSYKDKIIEDMEIMGLDRFDNSAVVIKARIKTIPGSQWEVKREYQNRLKSAFDNENIEIPFPHTTLYWGEKTPPLKVEINR